MSVQGWVRVEPGYYERDGWFIFRIVSDYGDVQWIVDAPHAPAFATCDTLQGAKATVARFEDG